MEVELEMNQVVPSSLDLLHIPAELHMGTHRLPQIVCLVLAWWSFHFEQAQVSAEVSRDTFLA